MYCKYVAGDWRYIAIASKLMWKQNIILEVHVAYIACLHLSLTWNSLWSQIMLGPLSYCTHTKPLSLFTCPVCNSVFLFSQKTGFLQLRFRLLLYFPCARHRHAFKGYDLFCTASDSAAFKVRELLFLLRIYALLKRKKNHLVTLPHIYVRNVCRIGPLASKIKKGRPCYLVRVYT